jgi:hypothetical protein
MHRLMCLVRLYVLHGALPNQQLVCHAYAVCSHRRKWRSSFFNWFYFVINIGSLVASTVVVGVQESKGYGIGFGIPTIFFAVVRHSGPAPSFSESS